MIGGAARGRHRPEAPKLLTRPDGNKRRFSMIASANEAKQFRISVPQPMFRFDGADDSTSAQESPSKDSSKRRVRKKMSQDESSQE